VHMLWEFIIATVVLVYLALALFLFQVCSHCFYQLSKVRCMWPRNLTLNWQSNDPMRPKVLELMTKRRLHRARMGSAWFSHMMIVYLLLTLAYMHSDGEVFRNDQAAWEALIEWELVTALVCLWATRLSILFPSIVRTWTLNLLVALILAKMVAREILIPRIMLNERYYIHYIGSQRLVLMFLLGNLKFSCAVNVAYSICNFTIYFINFGFDNYHHVYELLCLSLLLLMAWIFHTWTYAEARATLEAKSLRRSEATMHRLLSAMCDVVVHLGPDYLIRYPCPQLEVLLLKSRTRASLQGTPLTDLFPDESERDRFHHFLSSLTHEAIGPVQGLTADHAVDSAQVMQEIPACTFHSHLRDGSDTKVSVQIFHGSYADIDEQVCHVVGIREDMETASRFHEVEPRASADSGGGLSPLLEHCAMPMKEVENDSCSSLSASEAAGEAAVWVDTSTPMYKVVRCTAGFSELCGPWTESIELLKWIKSREESRMFQVWVEECFNGYIHGGKLDNDTCKIHMKLSPPHFRRCKLQVVATIELVEIEVLGDPDDSEASQQIVMQFNFSGISWIHGKDQLRPQIKGRRKDLQTGIVSM